MEIRGVHLPRFDVGQGVFRSWWLEPLIATLSFAASIHVYWYEERRRGLSRNNVLLETCGVTSMGDMYNSLVAYWVGICVLRIFASSTPSDIADGIPDDISRCCTLISEVFCGIVMYDAVFFIIHLLMHEVAFFKECHKYHHDSPNGTLEARDVLRHSLLDGALQVVCNIAVQQYNPWGVRKSRLARLVHNIIVPWMLTESHSASPLPWIWRRWLVGVRYHRLHHAGRTKHKECDHTHRYQQFFGYLDSIRARSMHEGSQFEAPTAGESPRINKEDSI
jgi:sterol desaturase/sphingolipid hydroxylase (fatty acid hydroxylase superfamily)